jgi:transposase-like protein/DNA-binding protein Fis
MLEQYPNIEKTKIAKVIGVKREQLRSIQKFELIDAYISKNEASKYDDEIEKFMSKKFEKKISRVYSIDQIKKAMTIHIQYKLEGKPASECYEKILKETGVPETRIKHFTRKDSNDKKLYEELFIKLKKEYEEEKSDSDSSSDSSSGSSSDSSSDSSSESEIDNLFRCSICKNIFDRGDTKYRTCGLCREKRLTKNIKNATKCTKINKSSGNNCSNNALPGKKYCSKHKPEEKNESKEQIIKDVINKKISQIEASKILNCNVSTMRRWIKDREKNVTPDLQKKYESGELPIPPKSKKKTDLSMETITQICKLSALYDLGKNNGKSRKELSEMFNITAKDTIRKIIKNRQNKHYQYWYNKFKK